MKSVIGGIMHETNTFSNVPTDEDSFRLWGWDKGEVKTGSELHWRYD